ncbi:hypothetical protein AWZ03_014345 [Drosophila navojoa]|uniref:Uncharacterized protein n=1 Tax=Drosophila navojoa TaxID=7232 RepID=A0A484AS48_DRONA|nr:hypothetical protein AWZ03_014345 [Drosophila navojoa]
MTIAMPAVSIVSFISAIIIIIIGFIGSISSIGSIGSSSASSSIRLSSGSYCSRLSIVVEVPSTKKAAPQWVKDQTLWHTRVPQRLSAEFDSASAAPKWLCYAVARPGPADVTA